MNVKNFSDLKKNNMGNIFSTILKNDYISRKELAESTQLAPSAITALTKDLIKYGYIYETSKKIKENQGRGRPPIRLTVKNDSYGVIGIEIGAGFYKIGIIGLAGDPIDVEVVNFNPTQAVKVVLDKINEHIEEKKQILEEKNIELTAVSISAPGLVDHKKGLIHYSPNLNWKEVNIFSFFEKRQTKPIILDNNVNLMAIGEKWFGRGQLHDSILFVHIGTGVGCAIILPQLGILRGDADGAGELGHITLKKDGPLCSCGKKGCLEALLTDSHIVKEYKKYNNVQDGHFSTDDIVQLAEDGDSAAVDVIKQSIDYLGLGIADVYNLIEPTSIIINGHRLINSPLTLKWLKEATRKYCFNQEAKLNYRYSSFGKNQTIIGTAAQAFKNYLWFYNNQ